MMLHFTEIKTLPRLPQVTGLKGLTYLDKSKDPKNPAKATEQRDAVTFGQGLVDSVYLAAPEHVELEVGTGAASYSIVNPVTDSDVML
jgi:hypothetical protein